MWGSLSGVIGKLKEASVVQKVASSYNKLKDQISKKMEIVEVVSNIYHITYPQQCMLKDLKKHIGSNDYQIWNIGEYRYDHGLQQKIVQQSQNGEVHHLCYEYYANLPLYELIIAINSIHYFLTLNPQHRVYLHCQDNKIRSSVFIVCYILKFAVNGISDITEAVLSVNKKLGVNLQLQNKPSQTANYRSQHNFLKNYINYLNNPQIINQKSLSLFKIIINDAPSLKIPGKAILSNTEEVKVCLQLRKKENVVFKCIYENSVFKGDSVCLQIGSNQKINLNDDFLVMIKYVMEGKLYGMMRIQLNTNFILDRFARTHHQFIDLSSYCLPSKKGETFVDFLFEENDSLSDLAKLQSLSQDKTFKAPKKMLQKQVERKEEQVIASPDIKIESSAQDFSMHDHEDEQQHQVDEHQINRKIQEVMKSITNKQDKQEEEEEEEAEQQDDLDDYMSKLQSQA